jgi:DNA-binding NarL/FixJ family response regulator/tetratricopeptide (TPR) repeat protein
VSETLVGRASELSSLDLALTVLERKDASALALVGEPGMGKTHLLAELSDRAEQRDALVLSGSASEFERELPYWVFVDALDEHLQGLEPRRLAALDETDRSQLGHVFPAFDADAAGVGAGLQDERLRTHRAVRRLLEVLAAPNGLVLLLDDLHWADAGTIELLGSLLRRPPAAAVLIVVAVRPRQLPARLSGTMERAIGSGAMSRLEVGALSVDEAQQLLGESVERRAIEALHAESGGNPFYLKQLARGPRSSSQGPGAGGVSLSGVEVPAGVAAALTEEFALLDATPRRVLDGASIVGDPFEPETAAAAAGVDEDDTLEALDELLRRDLVRTTEVPRRFRFRHPLVRAAVYDAAPGAWRLTAHERCAAALAARGAPAAEQAHHVERSARRGDAAAVGVLRDAARASAQRAPVSAARLYGAAVRLLPETAPAPERVALLSALWQAHSAAGQFEEAHAAVAEALDLTPGDDVARRLELTAGCAVLEGILGRHQQSHMRLTDALDRLSDTALPEAVELMLVLGLDGFYRRDYASMCDWTERALAEARSLVDRSLTATAAATLALAQLFAGDVAAARALRDEAATLVARLPDDELARHLDAGANLARVELYLDRFAEAGALADRTLAVARATGQGEAFPVPYWVGHILSPLGRLDEAAELLDAGVEAARLPGYPEVLAWSLMSRSLAAAAAGETVIALSCADESIEVARKLGAGPLVAWCGGALAAALLAAGEPLRAAQELVASAGGEQLPDIPGPWRVNNLELLTRCWLASGHSDEAARAAACAESVAEEFGLHLPRALADRAAAAVALDRGDAAAAAKQALSAAAAAEAIGAVVEGALGRVLAGRALGQAGDRKEAAAELQRAAADLEACGAHGQRDAAERELGRLGLRPHRRTRPGARDGGTGIGSLTGRELEVARLVVERKTNTQIAAELFLSTKTVESHIRHIFHKLSVSSRVEVARVVERADRESERGGVSPR